MLNRFKQLLADERGGEVLEYALIAGLIVGDLLDTSPIESTRFDLVTACDVFCYLGDLAPIFQKVAGLLQPAGLFAFTVEAIDEGEYRLRQTRRYAHSPSYIKNLAKNAGFEVVSLDRTALRSENRQDVAGLVVVLGVPSR